MSSKYDIKSLCVYYAEHEIAAVIKTSAGNAAKDFTGTLTHKNLDLENV